MYHQHRATLDHNENTQECITNTEPNLTIMRIHNNVSANEAKFLRNSMQFLFLFYTASAEEVNAIANIYKKKKRPPHKLTPMCEKILALKQTERPYRQKKNTQEVSSLLRSRIQNDNIAQHSELP